MNLDAMVLAYTRSRTVIGLNAALIASTNQTQDALGLAREAQKTAREHVLELSFVRAKLHELQRNAVGSPLQTSIARLAARDNPEGRQYEGPNRV